MFNSIRMLIDNTKTLDPNATTNIKYSNIVTTTRLFKNSCMPLESLFAQRSAPYIKSTPRSFPGVQFKIKDVIGKCTHVLFRSGKMNTVGACSIEHARYSIQCIRQLIEKITGVFYSGDDVVCSSLEGRVTLIRFTVVLMVANAQLDVRPNLKHVMTVAPDLAKWNPELFPGLKFLIWVSPRSKCRCVTKKNTRNCNCNVKVSIFDTGKLVITGGRSIRVVNNAMRSLQMIFSDTDYQNDEKLLEKHLRFEARRKRLLSHEYIEFSGFSKKRGSKREKDVFTLIPPKKKRKKKATTLPLFIYACDQGQIENVQFMMSIDKQNVDGALKHLLQIPDAKKTNKHYKIISFLS